MKLAISVATLAVTTLAANAVITSTKAVGDFTNNYNGDEIWDGSGYVNNWAPTTGANPVAPSLLGSTLTLGTSGVNGWIEQTTGDFVTNIGATSGWTLEITATFTTGDAVALWADGSNGGNGALIYVGSNGIGTNGNGSDTNQNLSSTSNIGTHTFRIAYDPVATTINVWRDGALVSDTAPSSNPGGGPRLIIGDCCSSSSTGITIDSYDLANISYDTTGGFAPVPEPSIAILALGGLALLHRRRS